MSADVEAAAREMGWRPEAEFRGDKAKWVDAETYVSRGENFIPILRADREKLRGENAEIKAALATTNSLLTASQEAIEELKRYHTEDTARQVEKARKDLVKQLAQARQDGDVEAEVDIQDELDKIRKAQATSAPPPPKKVETPAAAPAPVADPAFTAWTAANPWFGTSARLRHLAVGIGEELRVSSPGLSGKAFFEKLDEEMAEYLDPAARGTSKVEGGGPSGGGGNGGGGSGGRAKSYNDLPADAKEACNSFAGKLVGPGRAHKDLASWQAQYAKNYFAGE